MGWKFAILKLVVVTGGMLGALLCCWSVLRTPNRHFLKQLLLFLGAELFFALVLFAWLAQQ
jgi:hypothetical protein